MTRVPTYSNYMNLLNSSLSIKNQMNLYAFQATTGLKSPTYSGYGSSAGNIVNMEATLSVTNGFLENNKILNTEMEAMNTAMETVTDAVNDLKSMLASFGSMDLQKITPDYTGGAIKFTDNQDVYNGETITIDGKQYTFSSNPGDVGDEFIQIGNLTDAEGQPVNAGDEGYASAVMQALYDKVHPTNPDIKLTEDGTLEMPLYTINGTSSVLNANGVETGEPHEMNAEQYQQLKELQQTAFSTMQLLADALNTTVNGKYVFGGGNNSEPPVSFDFQSLEEFQAYYDGLNISYPSTPNANLSNREALADETGGLTFTPTGGNTLEITADNTGGFFKPVVSANSSTTGNLTFDSDKNSMRAQEYGAFFSYKAGDTMVIEGSGEGIDGVYTIKSVSEDGKTVVFEDDQLTNKMKAAGKDNITVNFGDPDNHGDIQFSSSFSIGSVVELNGFSDKNLPTKVQITGISDDGKTLIVKADRVPEQETYVDPSSRWSLNSESYYSGGNFVSERRISDSRSITLDITGNNSAFEKLFRALGQIAQGNAVDTRNPADGVDGLIDSDHTYDLMSEVSTLINDAVYNNGTDFDETNANLYSIIAKLSNNAVVLNNNNDNLELVANSLQTNIDSLKTVDQTEATVKALQALNNLQASYSVMQSTMNVSLLNYLK